jgi:tetratricopeptide (TPR) repeat protein
LGRNQKAFVEGDPKPYYRALKVFEGKYPALADCLPAAGFKLMLLLRHGRADESKDYAERLLKRATEQKNVFLLQMLNALLQDKKDVKELAFLAVRAAEELVHIDDGKDADSLMRLADTYFTYGDSAKAKECARKAIDAAAGESADDRQQIEKDARKYGAEK